MFAVFARPQGPSCQIFAQLNLTSKLTHVAAIG
jgi:hypothetical protein